MSVVFHRSAGKMIFKRLVAVIVLSFAWIKTVAGGTSYSNVYMQSGPGLATFYGPAALRSAQLAPLASAPLMSSLLPPCISPCVLPGQQVAAIAPVATSSADFVSYKSPISVPVIVAPANNDPTSYEYSYVVYDEDTGDQKAQKETSDGSVVRGQYSLIQPDGYVREVQYTADDIRGFNAVVKNFLPAAEAKEIPPCREVKKEPLKELPEGESHEKAHEAHDLEPEAHGEAHEVEHKVEEHEEHAEPKHEEPEGHGHEEHESHEEHAEPEGHESHEEHEGHEEHKSHEGHESPEEHGGHEEHESHEEHGGHEEPESHEEHAKPEGHEKHGESESHEDHAEEHEHGAPEGHEEHAEHEEHASSEEHAEPESHEESHEVGGHVSEENKKEEPRAEQSSEVNALVSYNDLIKCIQSAIKGGNVPQPSASPLTYIILNKPC